MFSSAHDFPKFVKVGAAMEHELRKVALARRMTSCCLKGNGSAEFRRFEAMRAACKIEPILKPIRASRQVSVHAWFLGGGAI